MKRGDLCQFDLGDSKFYNQSDSNGPWLVEGSNFEKSFVPTFSAISKAPKIKLASAKLAGHIVELLDLDTELVYIPALDLYTALIGLKPLCKLAI